VQELGILTTRDVRTVQRAVSDAGLLPLSKRGRATYYNSTDALKAIYRSGESAKERLDVARAELAEIELAEKRGELHSNGVCQAREEKRIYAARSRFLAMPSKLAGQFAPPAKLQQAEDAIAAAIYEALSELAGDAADTPR